jgi:hypothetical protein
LKYETNVKKKLFISHASEDKDDFVRPLAEALQEDFDVWYDEYKLVMGCSLLEEISKGLANCDFGVVILSNHFFAKNWPQQELNGLSALEQKNKKVILPIWKGVSKEDMIKYSPILADRFAAKAEDGVEKVVDEIKKAVGFFERGRLVEKPASGFRRLQSSLEKKAEEERSESIVGSQAGVSIAMDTAKRTIDILAEQVRSLLTENSIKGLRIDGPKEDGIGYRIDVSIGKIHLYAKYTNDVINSAADARLNFVITEPTESKDNYLRDTSQYLRDFPLYKSILPSRSVRAKGDYTLYINIGDSKLWKSKSGDVLTPEQLVDDWLERLSMRIENK